MPGLDSSLFTAVYQIVGLPAALLLIYWIAMKWMKEQAEKTSADRLEHINKWNSMIASWEKNSKRQEESHAEEIDRMFQLYERQIRISEMHAAELSRIAECVNTISSKLDNQPKARLG